MGVGPARSTGLAPAKAILVGEHFVVSGATAIAIAINLYAKASASLAPRGSISISAQGFGMHGEGAGALRASGSEAGPFGPLISMTKAFLERYGIDQGVDIRLSSEIPLSAGLGSSAAIAVSILAALSSLFGIRLGREEMFDLAFVSERILHGSPSGIDHATSIYGGAIAYSPSGGFRRLSVDREISLVIGDTLRRRSTREQVLKVQDFLKRNPEIAREAFERIRGISEGAIFCLEGGDMEGLGKLMNENQYLLSKVGASSEELDRLIEASLKAGAFGAKLTGAGGGGCMIALGPPEALGAIEESIRRAGAIPYRVRMDSVGFRAG
ncbi:MAG: mevalonate kinase [Candidatus Bathyarchaeia archaeon]